MEDANRPSLVARRSKVRLSRLSRHAPHRSLAARVRAGKRRRSPLRNRITIALEHPTSRRHASRRTIKRRPTKSRSLPLTKICRHAYTTLLVTGRLTTLTMRRTRRSKTTWFPTTWLPLTRQTGQIATPRRTEATTLRPALAAGAAVICGRGPWRSG